MLHPDPRAYRVALVADEIANDLGAGYDALAMLEASGFGVVVLPPSNFRIPTIARIVEYTVDDLVDYRNSGYRVIVVGSNDVEQFGVWVDLLAAEEARRALEPFERFDVVGTTAEEFATMLASIVPPALLGPGSDRSG